METSNHNKIINRIASEILKPIGLKRIGQSRTWTDDNIWFIILVEYQPSSWSKGTYLNIGINFNWNPKDYLSFDFATGRNYGDIRVSEFVGYKNDEQFTNEVIKMTNMALKKINEYRQFKDIDYAGKVINKNKSKKDIWLSYHKLIFSLIKYEIKNMKQIAHDIYNIINPDMEWQKELKDRIDLIMQIKTKDEAINYVLNLTAKTRELLKLPVVDIEEIRKKIFNTKVK